MAADTPITSAAASTNVVPDGSRREPTAEERKETKEEQEEEAKTWDWEDLLEEVRKANEHYQIRKIPIRLSLHRHFGKIYLQVVDDRPDRPGPRRHFRVVEEKDFEGLLRDVAETHGLIFDASG